MAKRKTQLKSSYDVANSRLLDSIGNRVKPYSYSLYDGAYPTQNKPRVIYNLNSNTDTYSNNVTDWEWSILLSRARGVYANLGSVKSAINEMADYSIGDGWLPKFKGEDLGWGKEVEDWLEEWFKLSDVRGQPWSLPKCLKLAVVSTIRDGDCLMVLTNSTDGTYPKIQWIPADRIGSRGKKILDSGQFQGYSVANGVIYNSYGAIVGYNIIVEYSDSKKDIQISVVDSQMVLDPEYIDQYRGLTGLASAICDWDDYKTIKSFEIKGIKAASNYALQMYVPKEHLDDYAGENTNDKAPWEQTKIPEDLTKTPRNTIVETLQGGEIPIWTADSGAKLEVLESNRPSANTSDFLRNHVLRHAFLSIRWPIEMAYAMDGNNSLNKLTIAKAQRRIDGIQSTIVYPVWKRIIVYAVSKAIKSGYLKPNKDFYKWEPVYPREFVIDNYKDVKSDIDQYNKGWITGEQICAQNGTNLEMNYRTKAKELQLRDIISKEFNVNPNELVQMTLQGQPIALPLDINNPTNI